MNKTSLIMLAVFALIIAVAGMMSDHNTPTVQRNTDYTVAGYEQSDIIVFTTSWCPSCKEIRNILDRNNVDYVELDIETDDAIYDEYDRLGGEYIPFIIYNGKVVDFRREDRLLKDLGYRS